MCLSKFYASYNKRIKTLESWNFKLHWIFEFGLQVNCDDFLFRCMQMPSFLKASVQISKGSQLSLLYRYAVRQAGIRPSYPFHTAFLFRNFITNKMDAQQYSISRISSVKQAERDIQLMTSCISATVSEITTKVTIKLHGLGNWKSHGFFYT